MSPAFCICLCLNFMLCPKPRITHGNSSKLNYLLFHTYSQNLATLKTLMCIYNIFCELLGKLCLFLSHIVCVLSCLLLLWHVSLVIHLLTTYRHTSPISLPPLPCQLLNTPLLPCFHHLIPPSADKAYPSKAATIFIVPQQLCLVFNGRKKMVKVCRGKQGQLRVGWHSAGQQEQQKAG